MLMGVPKEPDYETRVSIVPGSIAKLGKIGFKVVVESGAGLEAGHTDQDYIDAGATISDNSDVLSSDIILSFRFFTKNIIFL